MTLGSLKVIKLRTLNLSPNTWDPKLGTKLIEGTHYPLRIYEVRYHAFLISNIHYLSQSTALSKSVLSQEEGKREEREEEKRGVEPIESTKHQAPIAPKTSAPRRSCLPFFGYTRKSLKIICTSQVKYLRLQCCPVIGIKHSIGTNQDNWICA